MEDYENDEEEKEIIYWKVGSIEMIPQYFKFQSPQEIERVFDQKPNKL